MKLILGVRGSGKTSALIDESERTGYYIVVHNKKEASRVFEMSIKQNKDIPFPLTYSEFHRKKYFGSGIEGFLIDELDSFLLYVTGEVIGAVSLTPSSLLALAQPSVISDYKNNFKSVGE